MRGTSEGPILVQYHVYIMYMCSPLAYTHLESQVPVPPTLVNGQF